MKQVNELMAECVKRLDSKAAKQRRDFATEKGLAEARRILGMASAANNGNR
jgi:hypothetical protein